MRMNRRAFLKGSVVSGIAMGFPNILTAQGNKTYSTALVGYGWWGTNILEQAVASGRCKIVGLVDVDQRQLSRCGEKLAKWTSDQPRHYEDYREMLAKERPEIVIVATPDHWHALPMIAAVQAGAHVYVEKPIGHTVMEGRAMVNAARAAGRVVQVGTHRHVSPHNVSGRKFLREGNAGKIGMVRCFVQTAGGEETPRMNIAPPKGLNWDMWCGPAPLRPFIGDPESGKLLRREYRKPWVYPQA